MFQRAVDGGRPRAREDVIVGIGDTSVFDKIFKIAVRAWAPTLKFALDRRVYVFAWPGSKVCTYDKPANELSRFWI